MVCDYYRYIVFVCPFLLASLGTGQFMMIEGYTKAFSIIALVSNIINLLLDFLLIKYTGMGLRGLTLSTVLGYVGGTAIVIPWILSKKKLFHFVNPFCRGVTGYIFELFSAGASKFLFYLSVFINRVIMNYIILFYMGSIGLSTFAMCNSLIFLATSINDGSANAFLPIVGSLYGEKDFFGIRQCVKYSVIFVLCANVILLSFMMFQPQLVVATFGFPPFDTTGKVIIAVRFLALAVPVKGINSVIHVLYNTTEHSRLASVISILSGAVYTAIFAMTLPKINVSLFWLAFVCSEFATLLTIIVIDCIIKRKSSVLGFLLLKPLPEGGKLEGFTVYADKDTAVELSKRIEKLGENMGLGRKLSNRISIAIEEMTVAVYESSSRRNRSLLDITILKEGDDITVSFRENGKPCNLLLEDPEHPRKMGDGIRVFTEVAKSTEYSNQLGFNTIIAKF